MKRSAADRVRDLERMERAKRRVEKLDRLIFRRLYRSRRFRALVALLEEDGFEVGIALDVLEPKKRL